LQVGDVVIYVPREIDLKTKVSSGVVCGSCSRSSSIRPIPTETEGIVVAWKEDSTPQFPGGTAIVRFLLGGHAETADAKSGGGDSKPDVVSSPLQDEDRCFLVPSNRLLLIASSLNKHGGKRGEKTGHQRQRSAKARRKKALTKRGGTKGTTVFLTDSSYRHFPRWDAFDTTPKGRDLFEKQAYLEIAFTDQAEINGAVKGGGLEEEQAGRGGSQGGATQGPGTEAIVPKQQLPLGIAPGEGSTTHGSAEGGKEANEASRNQEEAAAKKKLEERRKKKEEKVSKLASALSLDDVSTEFQQQLYNSIPAYTLLEPDDPPELEVDENGNAVQGPGGEEEHGSGEQGQGSGGPGKAGWKPKLRGRNYRHAPRPPPASLSSRLVQLMGKDSIADIRAEFREDQGGEPSASLVSGLVRLCGKPFESGEKDWAINYIGMIRLLAIEVLPVTTLLAQLSLGKAVFGLLDPRQTGWIPSKHASDLLGLWGRQGVEQDDRGEGAALDHGGFLSLVFRNPKHVATIRVVYPHALWFTAHQCRRGAKRGRLEEATWQEVLRGSSTSPYPLVEALKPSVSQSAGIELAVRAFEELNKAGDGRGLSFLAYIEMIDRILQGLADGIQEVAKGYAELFSTLVDGQPPVEWKCPQCDDCNGSVAVLCEGCGGPKPNPTTIEPTVVGNPAPTSTSIYSIVPIHGN